MSKFKSEVYCVFVNIIRLLQPTKSIIMIVANILKERLSDKQKKYIEHEIKKDGKLTVHIKNDVDAIRASTKTALKNLIDR